MSHAELRKNVFAYLDQNQLTAKSSKDSMQRASIIFGGWLVFYIMFLILGSQWSLAAILLTLPWTLAMLTLQLGVMHDASHGSASNMEWLNTLLTLSIAFLGGSSILWIKQHCQAHHSFTNVYGRDHDIDTNGLLRVHPQQELKWHHRYQHIYAWLLYPLFLLNWVWWADFRDIIRNTYSLSPALLRKALLESVAVKIWHVFLFLLVPYYFFANIWLVIGCYLLSFMLMGFLMVVVFQLAHISNLQELPGDGENSQNDWVKRQTETTVNFATDNALLTWLIGGLNFQIEHHIFPNLNHINYPKIQHLVRDYCKRAGVRYESYPSVWAAVKGHQQHLAHFGEHEELRQNP